jgi:hypothetical protein
VEAVPSQRKRLSSRGSHGKLSDIYKPPLCRSPCHTLTHMYSG